MTEQQRYTVLAEHPEFEVRHYDAHCVAEVTVQGSPEDAANQAFGVLVGYLRGRNHGRRSLAMTAPVVQSAATPSGGSRQLEMTAPVVQRQDGAPDEHVVAFVMPAAETLESLPAPDDPRITVRAVPEEDAAALQYSGRWTESNYRERLAQLEAALAAAGLRASGTPRWARFDPPWKPWFLRRNEIVVPLEPATGSGPQQ